MLDDRHTPTSEDEFKELEDRVAIGLITHCQVCGKHFDGECVEGILGWLDTQIHGMCGDCCSKALNTAYTGRQGEAE